ncbi:MAG: hypothetical protein RLN86_11785 [Cyclobacteriaceae bacterium]
MNERSEWHFDLALPFKGINEVNPSSSAWHRPRHLSGFFLLVRETKPQVLASDTNKKERAKRTVDVLTLPFKGIIPIPINIGTIGIIPPWLPKLCEGMPPCLRQEGSANKDPDCRQGFLFPRQAETKFHNLK